MLCRCCLIHKNDINNKKLNFLTNRKNYNNKFFINPKKALIWWELNDR